MKLFIKSFCLLLAGLLAGSAGYAQQDTKSRQVLEAMSNKYKTLPSYKVSFSYHYGTASPAKGELGVKGEKYFLKLSDQEIYNNGKSVATLLKDSKEVTIQENTDEHTNGLNPASIFSSYQKGYKSNYIRSKTEDGVLCDIIALTPTEKNSLVSKVELSIAQKDYSLKTWKITEKNGAVSQYKVEKIDTALQLTDSAFTFDPKKYPGVEVVDLR